jgi:hypothetical protein
VYLKILRIVAAAKQSLAIHMRVSLIHPRLQSFLRDLAYSTALLSYRPSLMVPTPMFLHAPDAPQYLLALAGVQLA